MSAQVDDQERDPAERGELVLEPAVALGLCEPRDPFSRGREPDAVAGEAGADPDRDREMSLAGARRVVVALLMLWILCRSGCG